MCTMSGCEGRPLLHGENALDGADVLGIRAEAVDGFRGKGHQASRAQHARRVHDGIGSIHRYSRRCSISGHVPTFSGLLVRFVIVLHFASPQSRGLCSGRYVPSQGAVSR